jgi:hypothetical protein
MHHSRSALIPYFSERGHGRRDASGGTTSKIAIVGAPITPYTTTMLRLVRTPPLVVAAWVVVSSPYTSAAAAA